MLTLNVINPDQLNCEDKKCNRIQPQVQTPINSADTKRINKYTLETFVKRAREVHGDKYDYSHVSQEHIKGVKSKIPVICNTCSYHWTPTIDNHINSKRGCLDCAGQAPWTLSRFLHRATAIHGDNYDYSQITTSHIKNCKSKLPITCKRCGYFWTPSINAHIYSKSGCPDCAGQVPWTLARVILKGRYIHNDLYDYSQTKAEEIQGCDSRVSVICRKCNYHWTPSIVSHITQKHGCPNCARQIQWTLKRFVECARAIHKDNYDYSRIIPEHIEGVKSTVEIICKLCQYSWMSSINNHINNKRSCPNCANRVPWTLDRFLRCAREIHKDNYDYTQIKPEDVHTAKSKIPILCRTCQYCWTPTINGHINGEYGCPNCAKNAPWTLNSFIQRACRIHGEAFDYSQIEDEDIQGSESAIRIRCLQCNNTWMPSINSHINSASGCPNCNQSRRFSAAQIAWLEGIMRTDNIIIRHGLSLGGEYTINSIGKVDGFCESNNTVYEYHGDYWHGNPNIFPQDDPHPHKIGQTYGDLYYKTIERDQRIRELGYNLVIKWETE